MTLVDFDWRPILLLFVAAVVMLIWLVGCTIASDSSRSSAPTNYPRVTLTVGRLVLPTLPTSSPIPPQLIERTRLAYATPPPVASPSNASGTSSTRPTLDPELPNLQVPPPTCYENATGTILCLGRVDNPLPDAIGRVAVDVRIFVAGGTSFVQRTLIEQSVIPSGGSAPYRVLVPVEWSQYAGVSARLARAETSAMPDSTPEVQDQRLIQIGSDRYTLTALVRAPREQSLRIERAIVMLTEGERVRAYRVITFDNTLLSPDEPFTLRVDLTAQEHGGDLQTSVHVETHP